MSLSSSQSISKLSMAVRTTPFLLYIFFPVLIILLMCSTASALECPKGGMCTYPPSTTTGTYALWDPVYGGVNECHHPNPCPGDWYEVVLEHDYTPGLDDNLSACYVIYSCCCDGEEEEEEEEEEE